MKRALYQQLLAWKDDPSRKPLLLQGARQVGKTYLINQFGKTEYQEYIYLNFEQNPDLTPLFNGELTPERLLQDISLLTGKRITHKETLLFFDEIQTAPRALTALKYFQEQAPEYHIIAAGSLLGVSVGKQSSFPVGKINFLHMYPMSFLEYLQASGEDPLYSAIRDDAPQAFPDSIHEKFNRLLRQYLYLGGMPEVLQNYIDHNDMTAARSIQSDILEAYRRDFSKYTQQHQAIRTSEVWQSLPAQLSRENKKFKYSEVRKHSRASTFEQTITWLQNAGLIHQARQISTPKIPLSGYCDPAKFKIYLMDTGLLGAMLHLTPDIILDPGRLFQEYNGAFIENFVAQELAVYGLPELYYWTSKSDAEVDFIAQHENKIIPLEVKSGMSKNKKSLQSYEEKYKPEMVFRFSPRNFTRAGNFCNIPLYAGIPWLIKTLAYPP